MHTCISMWIALFLIFLRAKFITYLHLYFVLWSDFLAKLSSHTLYSKGLGVSSSCQADNIYRSYGFYYWTSKQYWIINFVPFYIFSLFYLWIFFLQFCFVVRYSDVVSIVLFCSTLILLYRIHSILLRETFFMPSKEFWSFLFQIYMCGSACSIAFFTFGIRSLILFNMHICVHFSCNILIWSYLHLP